VRLLLESQTLRKQNRNKILKYKKAPDFSGAFLLGVNSLDRSWKWNCLADMFDTTDPGDDSLDAHAKARVWD